MNTMVTVNRPGHERNGCSGFLVDIIGDKYVVEFFSGRQCKLDSFYKADLRGV